MPKQWLREGCRGVFAFAAVFVVAGVFGGCGSTQLVNLWQDPSYAVAPMKKILVMAMRKEPLSRRMWEDAFVSASAGKITGTVMVASYQLFPQEMPDPTAMDTLMAKQGIDGVLMVARTELDTLTEDMPGYTSDEQVTEYDPKWKTYVTRYEKVYHPGYTDTTTAVSVRTDLLLAQKQGQLVWSVTSQAVDPSSRDEVRTDVAGAAIKQLKKAGFIQ